MGIAVLAATYQLVVAVPSSLPAAEGDSRAVGKTADGAGIIDPAPASPSLTAVPARVPVPEFAVAMPQSLPPVPRLRPSQTVQLAAVGVESAPSSVGWSNAGLGADGVHTDGATTGQSGDRPPTWDPAALAFPPRETAEPPVVPAPRPQATIPAPEASFPSAEMQRLLAEIDEILDAHEIEEHPAVSPIPPPWSATVTMLAPAAPMTIIPPAVGARPPNPVGPVPPADIPDANIHRRCADRIWGQCE